MMYREKLMPGACARENLTSCCRRNAALSRHFQEVLGIDGQPEECAVIIGNCVQRGGVVHLVRTPYSHPEQQIMKEISTAVAARGAVEIAVNGLRMKLSVGSIESQPTGIPLLRIRTPNM